MQTTHLRTRLSRLNIGDQGIVSGIINCPNPLRSRLHVMGVVAGKKIQILNVAPLGDPMTISILGFKLALRLSEASYIEILPFNPDSSLQEHCKK